MGRSYLCASFLPIISNHEPDYSKLRQSMSTTSLSLTLRAVGLACAAWALISPVTSAAIVVPGADGSDGELVVTQNRVIDLSTEGVYDATQWAVVFKYSRVNIGANATVKFINHPSRAPVVWLVSGEVVIDGTLSLDAGPPVAAPLHSEPGPGGFRGGLNLLTTGVFHGSGLGPGGGGIPGGTGYGGSYATQGNGGPGTYGNASLLPLIGGSGGGGRNSSGVPSYGGGGGGGAILIASSTSVGGSGRIRANGGTSSAGGGGSGGGIRIVTDVYTGALQLQAVGGAADSYPGGLGRIRLERVSDTASPSASSAPAPTIGILSAGATAVVWPPGDAPSVRIVKVGGADVLSDPKATFGTTGGDVTIPATATTRVVLETVNVGQNWQVIVRGTPEVNNNFTTANATVESVLGNSPLTIRWGADLPVAAAGYMAFQAWVVRKP